MKAISPDMIVVVHRLPGRMRVRVPQLRTMPDCAAWLKRQLLSFPGVSGTRLRPEARSAVITYDVAATSDEQLLAKLRSLDALMIQLVPFGRNIGHADGIFGKFHFISGFADLLCQVTVQSRSYVFGGIRYA